MNEKQYFDNINGYFAKDSDVRTFLNINNFENYDSTQITYSYNDVTLPTSNRLTVATNTDGSLAKIYGYIFVNNTNNVEHLDGYVSIQSSLRPSEDIVINSLGMRFSYKEGYVMQGGYTCDVTIKTTGEIRLSLPVASDWIQAYAVISPCLLFIKNFGDTPIES